MNQFLDALASAKRIFFVAFVVLFTASGFADTTWISTSSGTYATAANWNNGLPSTGPQLGIFADSATIQHTLDITATSRNAVGLRFDLFTGGAGFTLMTSSVTTGGFQIRAGGTANGIINNDDNVQTFNTPMAMFTSTGVAGSAAAQTWNAAAGDLVFSGIYGFVKSTVNNNGGTLTIDGSFNTTIGSPTGTGDIVGSGGLTKTGTGTLTLGGTTANSFTGPTAINSGILLAAKANALGTTSGLTLAGGGTFHTGGLNQSINASLTLSSSATLDFGAGTSALSFANSSAATWTGTLTITNWTSGSDTFKIGTDATGLTSGQLSQINFIDGTGAFMGSAAMDATGFITPVPEPATWALLAGSASILAFRARRTRKS